MHERLQKVLAHAGLGSRRQIEAWIKQGRVTLNGRPAVLGDRMIPADQIRLDGQTVKPTSLSTVKRRVLIYHKPEGEICSRRDPGGRPTIYAHLPSLKTGRWVAVGRLDINSSGLLLLTTDGEMANRLMHPSCGVEREYAVRILGDVSPEMLNRLTQGVLLQEGEARFENITHAGGQGANHWYHVVLAEGRHREVRRLWESQGVRVSRLMRVRYGPVHLPRHLRPGHWEELQAREVKELAHGVDCVDRGSERHRKRTRRAQ
jgi:23S rRNA pseudouridine2605 synthase